MSRYSPIRPLRVVLLSSISVACCLVAGVAVAQDEARWLSNARQLTFEGRRAGEGYFSADGTKLVFQSERDPRNPFFQIFLMDLETGDTSRISPGQGKTTCAWIHPSGKKVLFASTHGDPESLRKQQDELEFRASGQQRRYSWDYDASFELYEYDVSSGNYTPLTQTTGYDAEGSYSPDGRLIAFASNRQAYLSELSPGQREAFERDPAVMTDIFTMNADGSDVTRLTHTLGYDGGPFFSPDGTRICWRRFTVNGATAEIMTMDTDGSDKRQLTHLDAMSWAPFYHPSGEYLIFATNLHGFSNFELYCVDVNGQHEPIRITTTDGFDGLPAFTPNGQQLAWTSNRTSNKQSQIFLADWNHDAVLEAMGLTGDRSDEVDPLAAASVSTMSSDASFSPADLMKHVDYLCRPELGGRLTGSTGDRLATSYVAAVFDHFGLSPEGDDGGWFQTFEFTAGVDFGPGNSLSRVDRPTEYSIGEQWQPLAFSKTGEVPASDVVFAGYGIKAPKDEDHEEYDSYVHLDVQDKWVLAFRFMPENISAEQRQHLSRHSSLRYKAMVARDLGARGLIVVSGPSSKVKNQLVQLQFDGSLAGASIPVVSVTDELATQWLSRVGKDLADLQARLDAGGPQMGFGIDGLSLLAKIDVLRVKRTGRNVLGRLAAGNTPNEQAVIICAHIDHLGTGRNASSLARDEEKDQIHFGADDNASGVAAMLEVAEYLSDQARQGKLTLKRDVIFAAWSGEELGLIGSNHYANQWHAPAHAVNHADNHAHGANHSTSDSNSLYPRIAACLNMDMVGRFEKRLVLQGVGSSTIWRREIERRNAPIGLPITLQNDSYLPTDASTFFMRGVPILSAFTGSHTDYHTPRDTPDKLNYEAAAKIANLMGLIARSLVVRETPPDYVPQTAPEKGQQRARLRAYLGTIPDYAESEVTGLKLSGVAKNGPAAIGGLRAGDLVVELAGRKIDNIYDYTYAIEALKIGQPIKITVLRGQSRLTLQVTPGSRE